MIDKDSIIDYFNSEASASRKAWEELMALPLKERIRKRKAIDGLKLVEQDKKYSSEGYVLLQFTYTRNLSDFKEGDALVLHLEQQTDGMPCNLNAYNDENVIEISVFPPNLTYSTEYLASKEWVLSKGYVDLRDSVYDKFCFRIPSKRDAWEKHLINQPTNPSLQDRKGVEEEVLDTEKQWHITLTEKQREAIVNAVAAEDYYLIQGPPGTGKSFVLGLIVLEELMYAKHSIVVIGPNHMAINNALGQVLKLCPDLSPFLYKVGQPYNAPTHTALDEKGEEHQIENISYLDTSAVNQYKIKPIIGFTPYCFYTRRANGYECDTLIIDEAGQMNIPHALMGMFRAKKVILAGDHKQLPPIIVSEEVPEEMQQSIFQKLMTPANHTMLDTSYRMCGPICDFVSALFYDGKLKAIHEEASSRIVCNNKLYSFDAPVVLLDVDDDGEQVSEKEASAIVDIIKQYRALGLPAAEIGVLSPFRAQAAHIRRLLKKENNVETDSVAVDTIDKMQGQEREVILFSLVAGDTAYMDEMADFLYNPNKLNVAFSRAKSKLIIVGNMKQLAHIDSNVFPHIQQMLAYPAEHIEWD